ncbi:MAG: Txe/YoeB family addiction module toxin [Sphaerochaetaceae bacterium]|nr:Txe/YoeB family addiction module toxin [Sphaerochaetaceae bacterium]
MNYSIIFTKDAIKYAKNLKAAKLNDKVKVLLLIIGNNPYQNPPPFEKLIGNLCGLYSRRINARHRLVYQINEEKKEIKVVSMWTHYEGFAD